MQVDVQNYLDIGHYLREVRESLGLDVRDVAHQLNIRAKYLLALENGDLGEIPGKVYARGYLMNYAEYLGLNKDEIAEEFDRLVDHQGQVKYFLPEPTERSYQPGMLVVGAALLMVVLIYVYWYNTNREVLLPPEREMVSPVPERLINPPVMPEAAEDEFIGPMPEEEGDALSPVEGSEEAGEETGEEAAEEGEVSENFSSTRMRSRKRESLPWLQGNE